MVDGNLLGLLQGILRSTSAVSLQALLETTGPVSETVYIEHRLAWDAPEMEAASFTCEDRPAYTVDCSASFRRPALA